MTPVEQVREYLSGGPEPSLTDKEYQELGEDLQIQYYIESEKRDWRRTHKSKLRSQYFYRQQQRGRRVGITGVGSALTKSRCRPIHFSNIRSGPIRISTPGHYGIDADGKVIRR